jgi:hypothetical protein
MHDAYAPAQHVKAASRFLQRNYDPDGIRVGSVHTGFSIEPALNYL